MGFNSGFKGLISPSRHAPAVPLTSKQYACIASVPTQDPLEDIITYENRFKYCELRASDLSYVNVIAHRNLFYLPKSTKLLDLYKN